MILLGGALMTVLVVMVSGPLVGAAFGGIVCLVLVAVAVRDVHGRSIVQRITTRVGWWLTLQEGSNVYRSGPLGRTAWGTCQLPGLAASSSLLEYRDSYDRPFALIHYPKTSHFVLVMATEPDGAALVDQEQVDGWVAEWGHWLGNLGSEPGVVGATVTIETAPDSGTRLGQSVTQRIDADAPELARQVLQEVVRTYPQGSSSNRAYVTVTFAGGAKRANPDDMARELAARLPGLTQGLAATGAGAARPMTAQELCEVIRIAYDPAVAPMIDQANAAGDPPPLTWGDVGPAGAEARWDSYRHDSGHSITWMMSDAPRGIVQSSVLTRLLQPHGDIARKRVTLVYRPIDAGAAASIVERDVNSARFNALSGDRPSSRQLQQANAALATANEEAQGAGLVNFGMFVTATVFGRDDVAEAAAAINNLGPTARVRLRVVSGSQDSAFAAALPLGLVLPLHLTVPRALRDDL